MRETFAKLIGQLKAMVEDVGRPDSFDAAAWISSWLREPLPAFGGIPPVAFMDTEGQGDDMHGAPSLKLSWRTT